MIDAALTALDTALPWLGIGVVILGLAFIGIILLWEDDEE